MQTAIEAVALRTVRYSDRHNILSVYTRQRGRMSLLIDASSGRAGARARALTMPLSLVECVADVRPDREISTIRDLRQTVALPGLHGNPVKMSVAMFMAEMLDTILRQCESEPLLFDFLTLAVRALDAETHSVANFHLAVLFRMGRFLGIDPDMSTYREGRVFDMADGCFRDMRPLHRDYLPPEEASVMAGLARITLANHYLFQFSREERRRALQLILRYYTLHYSSLGTLAQSLDVLASLYD